MDPPECARCFPLASTDHDHNVGQFIALVASCSPILLNPRPRVRLRPEIKCGHAPAISADPGCYAKRAGRYIVPSTSSGTRNARSDNRPLRTTPMGPRPQWIHDSSLVNRRWAAILLLSHRDPSLDKDLVDSLRDASGTMLSPGGEPIPESELHDLRLTIMDAVIVNGTGIPEDLAFSLFPRYPAQVVILLLRSNQSVETCVRLLNSALADEVWLVAASCLSATSCPEITP